MRNIRLFSTIVIVVTLLAIRPFSPADKPAYNKPRMGLWSLEISFDDKYFAFGGDDSVLQIYTTKNHSPLRTYKMQSMIWAVSWHPFKNLLAISLKTGVVFFDIEKQTFYKLPGITVGGRGLDWNYNGELLCVADGLGVVQIIGVDGNPIRSISKYNKNTYLSVHWHPSKNILVTSSDEIILFDTSGKQLKMFNHRTERTGILSVRWHPSGEFFASGDYGHDDIESLLQFWKPDGTLIKEIHGSKKEYRNIRWNKEGTMIATASDALRIWNTKGKLLNTGESDHGLWGISWTSDSRSIITAAFEGEVSVWDSAAKRIKKIP